jgi:predicted anti-sigma-YlaC factor YlaD
VADACRDQQGRLAMAAIGRLDEAEATALAAHLEGCDACRAEAAELQPVADALAEADPARAGAGPDERPQPSPVLRDAVLARLATDSARRRRRRAAVIAAVAAAVILVAGLAVGVLTRSDDPVGEEVALTGSPGGSAAATAVLEAKGWGTAISLEVSGLEPGQVYNLWLRQPDGNRVGAGSFIAVRTRGSMHVDSASGLHADQASGIGISTRGETVLYGHLEGAPDPPG